MSTSPIDVQLERMRERLGWAPYFVLVISLSVTALVAWYVSTTGRDRDRARFQTLLHPREAIWP